MTIIDEEGHAPSDERAAEPEQRSCAFEYEIRSDSKAGLTLEGYAAVFGQPARVVDWRGIYDEVVVRGAFTKTLQERKPVLLFEHGRHPLIGTMPIANVHRAAEDSRGVHVKATMFSNWLTAPIIDGVRAGEIAGMSYNFAAVKENWSADRSVRTVQELKLLMAGDDRASELSVTMAPVQAATSLSLRSILALGEIDDDEVRAALEAARSGTSLAAPVIPEAATLTSTSVPQETLELWARSMRRRTA